MNDRRPERNAAPARATFRGSFANVARGVRLIWQGAGVWTVLCAALVAVQGVIPVASAVALKWLTDAAVAAARDSGSGDGIVTAAGIIVALALASFVADALLLYAREVHDAHVDMHFQSLIQRQSTAVDLVRYEEAAFHDVLHLAQREVAQRPGNLVNNLLSGLQDALTLAGLVALLAGLHWLLPFVIVLVSLPELVVRFRVSDLMHRFHAAHAEMERRAGVYGELLTSSAYAKELRLYDLATHFSDAFRHVREAILADRRVLLARRAQAMILTRALPAGALFAGMVYLADRVGEGSLTAGDLVMFLAAFQQGQASLRALLRDIAALREDGLFLTQFFAVLDLRPAIVDPPAPAVLHLERAPAVRIAGVSFTYPGSDRPALADIDMELPAGSKVALVGRNGAGKSTLVKLLTRLYEPDAGSILLDGRPLGDYRLADLRRAIAVVGQDFARYPLSLHENVALGAVWRTSSDDVIRAALCAADAGRLEPRLKRGLATALTRALRDGSDLSLGEWQKVALARALHRDAPLMILDEPTSAMDAAAEDAVFANLTAASANRTVLLVTHRLAAARACDLIYVLGSGRIAEHGRHEELMQFGGIYARLFETQSRAYRTEGSHATQTSE